MNPGQTEVGTYDLPAGTYTLICDIPGHRSQHEGHPDGDLTSSRRGSGLQQISVTIRNTTTARRRRSGVAHAGPVVQVFSPLFGSAFHGSNPRALTSRTAMMISAMIQ